MKRLLQVPLNPVKRRLTCKSIFSLSAMPPTYQKRTIVPEIKLNATETKIRNLLVEYCDYYNKNQETEGGEDIVLRVTGGWVRDKLLGDESNDLDIAINRISGELFTQGLMQYIQENKTDTGIIGNSIHKIDKNPEKSKHLETCTTKLYGLDVDFVNLRNEVYTEESRIPSITAGTPKEDAFRRDATLNALFYNLQTGQVEDFTGRGLEDLSSGFLRTPLAPLKTFLDDPLRCLRLIRFASRFGFEIDPVAMELMKEESIRLALMKKISRERIGVEIHKTLQGPGPEYGLELIFESGLYDSIFSFGDNSDQIENLNQDKIDTLHLVFKECREFLGKFPEVLPKTFDQINSTPLSSSFKDFMKDKYNQKMFFLLLILFKWEGIKVVSNPKKLKSESYVTDLIMRDGLKYSAKESDSLTLIVNFSNDFRKTMKTCLDPSTYKRSDLGLLMKQYGSQEKWEIAFWFNLFRSIFESGPDPEEFLKLRELIKSENLTDVWALKPIMDGKTLIKELKLKPGPWMKKVNDEIFVWQLNNPTKTVEDCLKYVKDELL